MGETSLFVREWNAVAFGVNSIAVAKGWWDHPRNDGEIIALMHSELSEALEGLRHGNPPDNHLPQFSSVEVEMADTVIRIMDFAKARNLRVAEAIIAKNDYNASRDYMHGGKRF